MTTAPPELLDRQAAIGARHGRGLRTAAPKEAGLRTAIADPLAVTGDRNVGTGRRRVARGPCHGQRIRARPPATVTTSMPLAAMASSTAAKSSMRYV